MLYSGRCFDILGTLALILYGAQRFELLLDAVLHNARLQFLCEGWEDWVSFGLTSSRLGASSGPGVTRGIVLCVLPFGFV